MSRSNIVFTSEDYVVKRSERPLLDAVFYALFIVKYDKSASRDRKFFSAAHSSQKEESFLR